MSRGRRLESLDEEGLEMEKWVKLGSRKKSRMRRAEEAEAERVGMEGRRRKSG